MLDRSFKESYFKEKRVIDVAINFPIAEKNETKEIAGKLKIDYDGIFLEIFRNLWFSYLILSIFSFFRKNFYNLDKDC